MSPTRDVRYDPSALRDAEERMHIRSDGRDTSPDADHEGDHDANHR